MSCPNVYPAPRGEIPQPPRSSGSDQSRSHMGPWQGQRQGLVIYDTSQLRSYIKHHRHIILYVTQDHHPIRTYCVKLKKIQSNHTNELDQHAYKIVIHMYMKMFKYALALHKNDRPTLFYNIDLTRQIRKSNYYVHYLF